jgi:hypothetical protein
MAGTEVTISRPAPGSAETASARPLWSAGVIGLGRRCLTTGFCVWTADMASEFGVVLLLRQEFTMKRD